MAPFAVTAEIGDLDLACALGAHNRPATAPQFVYIHGRQVDALVMWDNRMNHARR
jgi:hypothetical protein